VKDEQEVKGWISRMWILLNNERTPGDMIGSFIEENPMDEKKAKGFILGFLNWANHTPRWVNKGNPANTTYNMKQVPQASPHPPQFKVIPGGQLKGGGNSYEEAPPAIVPTIQSGGRKPGRNDPCPCGSGKKYKHCCGKPG
jgi:preprotein translocase subunit SecA